MRQNVVNGINALLTSAQINQVTPRILIAPDYSANDYIAEQLEVVTNKLRGVGYIDSPRGATPADVVNRRQRYGGRMEILRPRVYSTVMLVVYLVRIQLSLLVYEPELITKKGFGGANRIKISTELQDSNKSMIL